MKERKYIKSFPCWQELIIVTEMEIKKYIIREGKRSRKQSEIFVSNEILERRLKDNYIAHGYKEII